MQNALDSVLNVSAAIMEFENCDNENKPKTGISVLAASRSSALLKFLSSLIKVGHLLLGNGCLFGMVIFVCMLLSIMNVFCNVYGLNTVLKTQQVTL